jgi:hypothetical protein
MVVIFAYCLTAESVKDDLENLACIFTLQHSDSGIKKNQ